MRLTTLLRSLALVALLSSTTLATTAAHAATSAPAPAAKPAATLVDLNSARREQLIAVPGIGEVIADRIIAARPFKKKSDLVARRLVTKAQYAKLAPHVIAKQP